MNVRPYQYLLAIAEHGSISKAASSLRISQPALSKFLQNTESDLSVKLFCRDSGNRLLPTDAGRIYLKAAQQILDIRQQTYSMISRLSATPSETLTVGVSPYRGSRLLSAVFGLFYERFSDIRLEIVEGYMADLQQMIRDGKISLAFGTLLPEEEAEFGFASFSYEQLMLTVPLSHPAASSSNDSGSFFPELEMPVLFDTPFVMWGEKTTNRKLIDNFLSRIHFQPTVVYESNNAMMVNEMLKQGIGAGFLPESFCGAGENRVYFSTWPPLQSFSGVFYSRDRDLTEAERYLIYLTLDREVLAPFAKPGSLYFNQASRTILEEFHKESGRTLVLPQ